jgi:type II secretory pathway pseudopilin PulG
MSPRRGISLFEAVAAVAIVGVTSVSALSAVGGEMRTAHRARRALEVEALATARLWDSMSLLNDRELVSLPDSVAKGKFDAPLDEYRWEATSGAVADQAGVYDVRVTIAWADGAYTLRTYFYRRPRLASANARGAR